MTTLAPSATNRLTVARPMPEQPPVTTATRSWIRPAMCCFLSDRGFDAIAGSVRSTARGQWAMKTFFSSVNAIGASGPSSRPRPDCL